MSLGWLQLHPEPKKKKTCHLSTRETYERLPLKYMDQNETIWIWTKIHYHLGLRLRHEGPSSQHFQVDTNEKYIHIGLCINECPLLMLDDLAPKKKVLQSIEIETKSNTNGSDFLFPYVWYAVLPCLAELASSPISLWWSITCSITRGCRREDLPPGGFLRQQERCVFLTITQWPPKS